MGNWAGRTLCVLVQPVGPVGYWKAGCQSPPHSLIGTLGAPPGIVEGFGLVLEQETEMLWTALV